MPGYVECEGTLPYANVLFGIYQPLIGWRSRRIIRLALLAAAVPVLLIGCSAKEAERPSVVHDLTPLQDASRVLTNPPKGWYQHYYDN